MRKWAILGALLLVVSGPALAQGPKQPVPTVPVVEVFGGYAFARFDTGGATTTNGHGVMGSFAWNAKPWVQIVADTSYNTGTTNGVKNTLYGNHFGPRFFYRTHSRLGLSPFAEFLVGGSHVNLTVGGGLQASDNGFSVKGGGGLDLNVSPHFAVRLFDADFYRTPFFAGHQNTIWMTSGFVIRFGGARPE